MFGIGMPELIIIMVIILIIFGAGKLPEIGAGMGKAINKEEYIKFISPKEFVDFIIHSIKYNSQMISDEIKLNRMGI